MMTEDQLKALAELREPFPDNLVSKKPKGTKAQNECKPEEKVNCKVCGGWHHPKIAHLDYVGHAALTDRFLDVDPCWTWEPFAIGEDGLPKFDATGGLWIKLTVAGMTRNGYGHAESSSFKSAGDREKEVIGDALRNAGMRFGVALELWHKGDLHPDKEDKTGDGNGKDQKPPEEQKKPEPPKPDKPKTPVQLCKDLIAALGWTSEQAEALRAEVFPDVPKPKMTKEQWARMATALQRKVEDRKACHKCGATENLSVADGKPICQKCFLGESK